ncbi:hypothetical protein HUJ04_001269 [Dendroctonus ponderosae]
MEGFDDMKKLLEACGQSHVLKFWDELNETQQKGFLAQLNSIDLKAALQMWQKAHVDQEACKKVADNGLSPIEVEVEKVLPHAEIEAYRNIGFTEIAKGTIAVIVLAGGQGTRLGMPYPKGMCPTGIPSGKTLFQLQAERIQRLIELAHGRTGVVGKIPWYFMTSDATHVLTEKFLQQNNYFNLGRENVRLFKQALVPCFDLEGKLLMEEKDEIAMTPDGNGGLYRALREQKIIQEMEKKGIKYIHIHSVDNILVKVADPVFMGKCIRDQVDFGLKVIKKTDPTESLGLVLKVDSDVKILEYSEIPAAIPDLRKTPDDDLVFNAGNICNHFFTIDFLRKVSVQHESDLTLHMAQKIVTQINGDGDKVVPTFPNCIKIEKFIFDVIGYTQNFLLWQIERFQEFSPIKNSDASGKVCFLTAKKDLLNLHKRWIETMGGKCQGEGVEVSPLLSYEGEGLALFRGREFMEEELLLSEKEETKLKV